MPGSEKLVIAVFQIIIFISFIKYLFWGGDDKQLLQKLMGGFAVLIIAILSHNAWVYSVAILIGGLIIASENFIMFIAAVMRSRGDKVADTVNAFRVGKASEKEIEAKIKHEEKVEQPGIGGASTGPTTKYFSKSINKPTAEHTQETKLKYSNKSDERAQERTEKLKNIERMAQEYLREKFGEAYEPHMKLMYENKSLIVDGLIRKGEKVKRVVEIKYLSSINSFQALKFMAIRFNEKVRKLNFGRRILLVIVSEKMTLEDALKMSEDIKGFAMAWFFKLEDGKIEPVLVEEK